MTRGVVLFWIQAVLAGLAGQAADIGAPAPPKISGLTRHFSEFGAVADGKTDNAPAFARAFSALAAQGGGTLVVDVGSYFSGPLDLVSRLNLRLEKGTTILFTRNLDAYRSGPDKYRALLRATDLHDVVISGEGTIDGGGDAWWKEARRFKAEARAKGARNDTSPRPNLVGFDNCERVRLEGITLTNSPKFNFVPARCQDVSVDGITILNPADSPNTDGIDPSVCQRVLITHCYIDTGDDCIAVKSGANKNGDSTRDLLVENCQFKHGHGCSIGSETTATVENMLVRNCTFENTDIGVRLKSDRLRGGVVENVTYENLRMKNVGQPVVITSYYVGLPKPGQRDHSEAVTKTTPIWRKITLRNIVATGSTRNAGLIIGLPEMPVAEILFDHVQIEAPEGLRIAYAENVQFKNSTVLAARGPGLLIEDTAKGIIGP